MVDLLFNVLLVECMKLVYNKRMNIETTHEVIIIKANTQ